MNLGSSAGCFGLLLALLPRLLLLRCHKPGPLAMTACRLTLLAWLAILFLKDIIVAFVGLHPGGGNEAESKAVTTAVMTVGVRHVIRHIT
jgi:hypothetical protein